MIEIINGNLLCSDANFICHQVNPNGIMGRGVAGQIKRKWPEVYSEYKEYCHGKTCKYLLGKITMHELETGQIVVNLFGQTSLTNYEALNKCFSALANYIADYKLTGAIVAMPYGIGCGFGGGDWNIVHSMIENCFKGIAVVHLYKYE